MKIENIDSITVSGQAKDDCSRIEGCGLVNKYEFYDEDSIHCTRADCMRDAWYIVVYNRHTGDFRMIEVWADTINVSISKSNKEKK